jgi:maltooligosyltrehalose trehalohydrolase
VLEITFASPSEVKIMMLPNETEKKSNRAAGSFPRRLPVGAEVIPGRGVHFRVWAPDSRSVDVSLDKRRFSLKSEQNGYFSLLVLDAYANQHYVYLLNGSEEEFPDPASRYQPDGPFGPSQIVDPRLHRWSDDKWQGVGREGQVLYEMHVGTFTPEGTFAAAAEQLPELADLGVTVVELMPIVEFSGNFGWGYDGINIFAPTRLYGNPDEVRCFVDRAHAVGVGVVLDVVYNHFGPAEKLFSSFSKQYFSDCYKTDWGKSPNFDGLNSKPVREYFISNASCWIDEYHMDGLRFDATQNIYDASDEHILCDIVRHVRMIAPGRSKLLIAENEKQKCMMVRERER